MPTAAQVEAFTHALRRLGLLYTRVAGQASGADATFTKQELLALGVLGVSGPSRMGALAEGLAVGQSAVTPLVDRLEARGVVRRERSAEDRRAWVVALTSEGERAFAQDAAVYRQVATAMLAPLDPDERVQLLALLEKVGAPNP